MGVLVKLRGLLVREVLSPVSEMQAYDLYLAHLHACPVCSTAGKSGMVCSTGLELHEQWKHIEASERPPALPPRRRVA